MHICSAVCFFKKPPVPVIFKPVDLHQSRCRAVTRLKRFFHSVLKHASRQRGYVASIKMDANAVTVGKRVAHGVDVANVIVMRGDGGLIARVEARFFTDFGFAVGRIVLTQFTTAQNAHPTGHRVIVNGRALIGTPHKTTDTKALSGVYVQFVLLVILWVALRVAGWQPVVGGDELRENLACCVQPISVDQVAFANNLQGSHCGQ